MSKVITLRLSEEEYRDISAVAKTEHRAISNLITTIVMKDIKESYFVEPVEMAQIKSDKKLIEKLKAGHRDVKSSKGRFVE